MNKRGLKWWFTNYPYNQLQTTVHKFWVLFYILKVCWLLIKRGLVHDLSKYGPAEAMALTDVIFDLKKSPYGSDAYKRNCEMIRPCLSHHYSLNSHHPEFHADGFTGMAALDRIEMIADWCAASRRHKDGCIIKSIEFNQERFKYSDADKNWFESLARTMKS